MPSSAGQTGQDSAVQLYTPRIVFHLDARVGQRETAGNGIIRRLRFVRFRFLGLTLLDAIATIGTVSGDVFLRTHVGSWTSRWAFSRVMGGKGWWCWGMFLFPS